MEMALGAKLMRLHHTHDIYHHSPQLEDQMREVLRRLDLIIERLDIMSETLDRATASLVKITNANVAVKNMIAMFIEQVRGTGTTDPAVLAKLDEIDAQTTEIANAALANTPSAPVPPVV